MAVNTASGFRPDEENVVYIGAGVTLKGEISVPELIVIDGEVEGVVTARVVCVGPTGVIRGNIAATDAEISGLVTNHIEIKQLLVVRATGRVEGRVIYGEIELEKGAVLTGDLAATEDYRAAVKLVPAAKGVAKERAETIIVKSESGVSGVSTDRLNEAVRAAKNGAAKGQLSLATESEKSRRSVLRMPLSSCRFST